MLPDSAHFGAKSEPTANVAVKIPCDDVRIPCDDVRYREIRSDAVRGCKAKIGEPSTKDR